MAERSANWTTLRALAERYGEIARLDVQRKRLERFRDINALKPVRPVLLISEVPWGEIRDEALVLTCGPEVAGIERRLRQTLYQWEHFQGDMVVPPVFDVSKRWHSTGIGLRVTETVIRGDTGAAIASHAYRDQLQNDEDLARLQTPRITCDPEATERPLALAAEVFDGILPVEPRGTALYYNLWDDIARYRGVEPLLTDLVERPDFMHRTVRRFADIAAAQFRQLEALDLLDPDPLYLHCTAGSTRELPAADFAGKVRRKDVWGRCAAQIFGSVSPAMHDAFDLAYNADLFGGCGLVYYGCCEPMDRKIDLLRQRFANLRKVSITPWADPERAAEALGRDLVMAAKPNPAFVASAGFDPAPVREEMTRYLEACRRHGTPCEFVLKDISTIANRPENLTRWAETASAVIDRYWG